MQMSPHAMIAVSATSPDIPAEVRNLDRAWTSVRNYERIGEGAAVAGGVLLSIRMLSRLVSGDILGFLIDGALILLFAAVGLAPRLLKFRHGIGFPRSQAAEERELIAARARTTTYARFAAYALLGIFFFTHWVTLFHATALILLGVAAESMARRGIRRALAHLGVPAFGIRRANAWMDAHWQGRGWFGHVLDFRIASVPGSYGGWPVLHLATPEGEMLWQTIGTTLLAVPRRGPERPLEGSEKARYATLGFEVEVYDSGLVARSIGSVVSDPLGGVFEAGSPDAERFFAVAMHELHALARQLGREPIVV